LINYGDTKEFKMQENTIEWLIEKHVILSKVHIWDADSLADHILEVNALVNQSDLPLVHTLWDFQDLESYPTNLNAIRKAVQPLFTNEQCGWVITVMQNPMVAFLAQAGSSMYGVRYRTFKAMDDALEFLQGQDTTLPRLL